MPPQTTTHSRFCMAGKTALVAEGGGMRGVFTAGVLDAFLVNNYNPFNLYIGCSAGALNLSSYIAGQYRHGYRTISDFTTRPEFYNWSRFLRGGHAIDLDWLWEATDRENPLQIDAAARQLGNREFLIGASHAGAGEATYHHAVPSSWQQLLLLRHQPAVADMIMKLEQRYNQACEFIRNPPSGVEVIEIAPASELATPMLSRNQTTLAQDYHAGCEAGMHFLYQQGICQHCLAA